MNIFIVIGAVLLITLFAVPAFAKNIVVASDFYGQLLVEGDKPVANQTVIRRWHFVWSDKKGEQSTTTDEKGNFFFPEHRIGNVLAAIMPHEPRVLQHILTLDETGNEQEFWYASKAGYAANDELNRLRENFPNSKTLEKGKLDVVCYLDKEVMSEERFVYASSCELRD